MRARFIGGTDAILFERGCARLAGVREGAMRACRGRASGHALRRRGRLLEWRGLEPRARP